MALSTAVLVGEAKSWLPEVRCLIGSNTYFQVIWLLAVSCKLQSPIYSGAIYYLFLASGVLLRGGPT